MGKTPSRKRYEAENPVVAFRVSKETKEHLDDIVDGLDTTKKDWFEGIVEDQKREFDQAWEKGYESAKEEYKVEVPCVICGEDIPVTREDAKEEIAEIIWGVAHDETEDLFWWRGHEDCL